MLHRLPEQHECLFDHLGRGRQEAVLKMVKLDRKVGRSCQRIGEECSWASSHSEEPPCSDCVLALAGFIFSLSFFFSPQFFFLKKSPTFTYVLTVFHFRWPDRIPAAGGPFGKIHTLERWNNGQQKETQVLLPSFWLDMCGTEKNK